MAVNATLEMLNDDRAIEAIVSMLTDLQDRENINLPLYEQQLSEVNVGINNLLNAIQQGILTKSTKARLEKLENTRDELENKIVLEKLAKPKINAELMTFWLHRFRKLDVAKKEHRQISYALSELKMQNFFYKHLGNNYILNVTSSFGFQKRYSTFPP